MFLFFVRAWNVCIERPLKLVIDYLESQVRRVQIRSAGGDVRGPGGPVVLRSLLLAKASQSLDAPDCRISPSLSPLMQGGDA